MRLLSRLLGPLLARELMRLSRGPMLRLIYVAAPIFVLLLLLNEGNETGKRDQSLDDRAASAALIHRVDELSGRTHQFPSRSHRA